MGKLLQIFKKNLKVMLRSKLSHLLIFIGPLIVILLLGFFYYNDNGYNINVGFYSPENTSLTQSYIQALKENNFKLLVYENKEACEKGLKSGLNHVCIFFPSNFKLGKSNQLEIKIDSSKNNINSIVKNLLITALEKKQKELQLNLTGKVVSVLNSNEQQFITQRQQITTLATKNKQIGDNFQELSNYVAQLNQILNFEDSGIDDVQNSSLTFKSDLESFLTNSDNSVTDIRSHISDLEDYVDNLSLSSNETTTIGNYIDDIKTNLSDIDTQLGKLENLKSVEDISDNIDTLKNSLDNIESNVNTITSKIKKLAEEDKTSNSEMAGLISNIENTNEQVISQLSGVEVKDANSIVKSVSYKISSITPDSSKHFNSIIASLLVGLIMIISLLLSSNLVLMEKKSLASFRNYMVTSSGFFFLIGNFLTLLFIITIQISSIVLVYYFLFLKIFTIEPLILILVCIPIISFFILLGISLGNISSNSTSNVISIFIVIFLFMSLSGTILPLEILSSTIVSLSFLNPYLVSESIIRQILLFDASFLDLKFEFLVIGLYILVFLIIAYILEEITRKRDLYQIFVLIGLRIKNRKSGKKEEKNKKEKANTVKSSNKSEKNNK